MKTAQIARRFTFSEWGGTETVVWNTAKALSSFGDTPEIIATKALDATEYEEHSGLAIRRFPYIYPYFPLSEAKKRALDKKGGNPYVFGLGGYLEKSSFDLIHCHAAGRVAELVRKAALKLEIPYIMSFHGGFFDVPREELSEMLRPIKHTIRYGGVIDRMFSFHHDVLADASCLICVGRNELRPAVSRYPEKRVEYIPNGVDAARFSKECNNDFRQKYSIPRDRRMLLTVARIDYQKNQLSLLDILNRLPDAHLVLIGAPTAEWYLEKIRKTASEMLLNDRLTIIPGLPQDSEDITDAYHAADLFLLPSLHEPFGIVVLEAWCAHLPVIVSNTGGLSYLVRDGENGFFSDFANSEATASLIQSLTPETLSGISENAYIEALRDYSWEVIARRVQSLYSEVIKAYKKN